MDNRFEGFGIAVVYVALGMALWVVGRAERKRYLYQWTISLLCFGGHSLVNAVVREFGVGDRLNILAWILLVAGCWAVAAGAQDFIGRPVSRWLLPVAAVLAFAASAALALGVSVHLVRFPVFAFIGAALAGGGVALLRHGPPGGGRTVSGTACIAAGIYGVAYPWLHGAEWLRSLEFFIDLAFVITATTGVVLMHFELARSRAEALAARYKSLFESAQVGLFRVDPAGRMLAANPALLELLATTERRALGLNLVRDVYVERAAGRELAAALAVGKPIPGHEARWRRQDGTEARVNVAARPVSTGAGETLYFEGSAHDVTYERQLRQQLEQTERLDAVGRLASGIAHDFNNVLTVVINGTELARARLGPDAKAARELLDTTLEASRNATQLTRQLLAFGRRRSTEKEPIELNVALRSLTRMLDSTLGERVRVTLEPSPEPLAVLAQPGQIEQLVTNLALNSRDAMGDGGSLGLSTRRVELEGGRAAVRITVSDDGCGMTEATRRRLFEPYFTTKEFGRGTGIGLATVYAIVKQLEGRIEVQSAIGQGTTVTVDLPASPRAETAGPPPRRHSLPPTPATVLMVEDRELLRRSTELALRESGHRVLVAASGPDALAVAAVERFDVLLTDVVMPGMGGLALAEELRLKLPRLAVVFMSGHLDEHTDVRAFPASRFLPKPFTVGELAAAIEAAVHAG